MAMSLFDNPNRMMDFPQDEATTPGFGDPMDTSHTPVMDAHFPPPLINKNTTIGIHPNKDQQSSNFFSKMNKIHNKE